MCYNLYNDKKKCLTLRKRNVYNIVPLSLPHLQHCVLGIYLAEISVDMIKNELLSSSSCPSSVSFLASVTGAG